MDSASFREKWNFVEDFAAKHNIPLEKNKVTCEFLFETVKGLTEIDDATHSPENPLVKVPLIWNQKSEKLESLFKEWQLDAFVHKNQVQLQEIAKVMHFLAIDPEVENLSESAFVGAHLASLAEELQAMHDGNDRLQQTQKHISEACAKMAASQKQIAKKTAVLQDTLQEMKSASIGFQTDAARFEQKSTAPLKEDPDSTEVPNHEPFPDALMHLNTLHRQLQETDAEIATVKQKLAVFCDVAPDMQLARLEVARTAAEIDELLSEKEALVYAISSRSLIK